MGFGYVVEPFLGVGFALGADGPVGCWAVAVVEFAEVGFGAVQLVSLNAEAHRVRSVGLESVGWVFVRLGA